GILPAVDLVIAGEKAIDGDTGQIGPEVAAFLDLPIFSYVIDFYLTPNGHFHIERLTERGSQSVEIDPPCVVTVTKGINVPRFPTLHGKRKARQKIIQILDASSLPIHRERIGLEGSPTRVVKVENVQVERKGIILRDMDEVEMAERFIQFLEEKGVLKNGSNRE
ncbi:MAG: electron transfer flavoprotein subunit beta, partial [Atribacterota bacterium]